MPQPPSSQRSRVLLAALVAGVAALGAGIAIGVGEGGSPPPDPAARAPAADVETGERLPPDRIEERFGPKRPEPSPAERQEEAVKEGPSGPPPASSDEHEAAAAVRAYVKALTARDGSAVCDAFEPGALDAVEFPRPRGSCAATVEASLGYRDPRGFPAWRSSELTESISAQVSGDEARVTATVFTEYADDREPTIEDDVVYLRRARGGWLLVQPTATLYRAIGVADIPLSAFAPPG